MARETKGVPVREMTLGEAQQRNPRFYEKLKGRIGQEALSKFDDDTLLREISKKHRVPLDLLVLEVIPERR